MFPSPAQIFQTNNVLPQLNLKAAQVSHNPLERLLKRKCYKLQIVFIAQKSDFPQLQLIIGNYPEEEKTAHKKLNVETWNEK